MLRNLFRFCILCRVISISDKVRAYIQVLIRYTRANISLVRPRLASLTTRREGFVVIGWGRKSRLGKGWDCEGGNAGEPSTFGWCHFWSLGRFGEMRVLEKADVPRMLYSQLFLQQIHTAQGLSS